MSPGNFSLVGALDRCPDVFVVMANASAQMVAVQATVCRKLNPREDDDALWKRVKEVACKLDQRRDPYQPIAGYHGGTIFCDYGSTQLIEDSLADEIENFKRAIRDMARNDPDAGARSYAQGVWADWVMAKHAAGVTLQ